LSTSKLSIYLISFSILIPVFLSIDESGLSFSRVLYYDNDKYSYTMPILFLGFSNWLKDIENIIFEFTNQGGFVSRTEIIKTFLLNLSWENFFFLFLGKYSFYDEYEYHSQYLNICYTFEILGFYFFSKLVSSIIIIKKTHKDFSLMIISTIFLVRVSFNSTPHPYLVICLGVLVGYISCLIKVNQQNNVFKKIKI
jgi:hypothetical protein